MQITVEIDEQQLVMLVRGRIAELFSDDSRFRETSVRDLVRKIVDDAAVKAVVQARDAIAAELPAIATEAVRRGVIEEIGNAARRGLRVLHKLYAGFDPHELTEEQRAWLEGQIAKAANSREGEAQ